GSANRGTCPIEVLVPATEGVEVVQSLADRPRCHLLIGIVVGRAIDRRRDHGVVEAFINRYPALCTVAVVLDGRRGGFRVAGRCAHHSVLGLVLAFDLALSILGLAGAASGSVLGRGVGSVLRPRGHLLVRRRGILG